MVIVRTTVINLLLLHLSVQNSVGTEINLKLTVSSSRLRSRFTRKLTWEKIIHSLPTPSTKFSESTAKTRLLLTNWDHKPHHTLERLRGETDYKVPIINIENGLIRGIIVKTINEKPYLSYRGIPYALPPKQRRRFMPPKPYNIKWEGIRDMTSYKSGCLGLSHEISAIEFNQKRYYVTGDEDCLYLNVHMRGLTVNDKRAVIFFIHGGVFSYGSPQDYEATFLMQRDDVVYVNPAYRLGPLGFLSTGDEIVPGNNGLKDQLLALKWVNKNIHAFGGSPSKVQIAGVDAGAASAHFMMLALSPSDLFSTAVSFSGTAYSPWAFQSQETAKQRAKKLAGLLKCPTENSTAIVDCLRNKTATEIVDNVRHMKIFFFNPFSVFTPVDDSSFQKPFFPNNPIKSLDGGSTITVPWITGMTSLNGHYPLAEILKSDDSMAKVEKNWHEYLPSFLFYNESCEDIAFALRGPFAIPMRKGSYNPFLSFLTDRIYLLPGFSAANATLRNRNNKNVYVYYFSFERNQSNTLYITGDSESGKSLGDDVAFIFKRPQMETPLNDIGKKMSNFLIDLLISHANIGRPPPDVNWKPITFRNDIGINVYELKNQFHAEKTLVRARFKTYYKFDYLFENCSL